MVQISFAKGGVQCKVVYYGPAESGKTANLRAIHGRSPAHVRGALTTIATDTNRTLFFDFLPLDLGEVAGIRTRIHLYAVPYIGNQNALRSLVLEGADGVVFVADSRPDRLDANREALANLRENLAYLGRDVSEIPVVFQWNRVDCPDALGADDLAAALNPEGYPAFAASAAEGTGVFDTLKAMTQAVLVNVSSLMASAPRPSADENEDEAEAEDAVEAAPPPQPAERTPLPPPPDDGGATESDAPAPLPPMGARAPEPPVVAPFEPEPEPLPEPPVLEPLPPPLPPMREPEPEPEIEPLPVLAPRIPEPEPVAEPLVHVISARDPQPPPEFDDFETLAPPMEESGTPTPPAFIAAAAAELADVAIAAPPAFESAAPHAPAAFAEADMEWAEYDRATPRGPAPPTEIAATVPERFVTVGGPTGPGHSPRPTRAGWERPITLDGPEEHDVRVVTDRRKRPRLEDAAYLSDKQVTAGALAAVAALSVIGYLVHVLL